MKQQSNVTGRSDSSLGAMRRSGSFSFAHFYQNCVSLMSNRDASFVGVFPTLDIRGVIGTTVVRKASVVSDTQVVHYMHSNPYFGLFENHESNREKMCFRFSGRV